MATLQERLDAAQAAYDALMEGRSVVEVRDANGEVVRYRGADSGKLAAHIANLERQIAGTSGCGPLRPFFA